ncbi:hypothetical protein [Thermodesulforhabdus norvegica]|uniref:Chordopoxvirus fusion protein n=1 Tax=Thermodesulforhabdus norvegica TaxID=39841 RepID=A0A1I4W0Y9_9BACT|nr:hypothetical protein [Thermodesulforhabdus norvegica]SFN07258.1 hypothetical protein SAMN05660836_02546 [Thermodesulforhabdus norvegica]
MIDTLEIYNELKTSLGDETARKVIDIIRRIYDELSQTVRRDEFHELKTVVAELAEAQRNTEAAVERLARRMEEFSEVQRRTEERLSKAEERLTRLENAIISLAEAQRRTEERVEKLEIAVEKLAEAQRRTEERVEKLEIAVEKLAEAQRRTEERVEKLEIAVEKLAEAQRRTEERVEKLEVAVERLAEAQKKTEIRLEKLIQEHKKTREQLGGLSHAFGYRLEDEAIWALPTLLKRDFGIVVSGNLRRGYLEVSPGKYIEVNIWGEGEKNGRRFCILGEAKTQLKNRDVSNFVNTVQKVEQFSGKEIFPVLITYQTSPKVMQAAEKAGIKVYFSFELRT